MTLNLTNIKCRIINTDGNEVFGLIREHNGDYANIQLDSGEFMHNIMLNKVAVYWSKQCACCKVSALTTKMYSLDDLHGNGVQLENDRIQTICDECNTLYSWTKSL